jgi:mono/diheme cytochrome c family protein
MKDSNTGNEEGADFNVREKHGQIWREYAEPYERFRAMPWWLKHLIYAPLTIWAIWYLIVYSGSFKPLEYYEGHDGIIYNETASKPDSSVETSQSTDETPRKKGEQVYTTVCVSCHQATGLGVAGAFPPLVGSEWVSGSPKILAAAVVHGLSGPIEVKGAPYNGAMPPWGATLSDDDIANVLTYIRSAWGNTAPPVDAGIVTPIRKAHASRGPWTAAELKTTFPD